MITGRVMRCSSGASIILRGVRLRLDLNQALSIPIDLDQRALIREPHNSVNADAVRRCPADRLLSASRRVGVQVRIFLCGDVMTGRGIDQILAKPLPPRIHEPYARSALEYVQLAEDTNGPIPRNVSPDYIWGDALAVLDRFRPDARVVNLETAVTCSDAWLPKGINYRMHPENVACLQAAKLDCCVLANNHVLDWGVPGLLETLDVLHAAGLSTAGAGCNRQAAEAPATVQLASGRLLVFAVGAASSGVPAAWAAAADRPGVAFVPDLDAVRVHAIAERVRAARRPGDLVVVSVHWGPNWGYRVERDELAFARALIDNAGVDVFHGHSSHHPKALEVYRGKLVLLGCGDFLNDYEGISGYEEFRGDLSFMYLATLDAASGRLIALELVPTQIRRFQIRLASAADARWMCSLVNRESRGYGVSAELAADGRIVAGWPAKREAAAP